MPFHLNAMSIIPQKCGIFKIESQNWVTSIPLSAVLTPLWGLGCFKSNRTAPPCESQAGQSAYPAAFGTCSLMALAASRQDKDKIRGRESFSRPAHVIILEDPFDVAVSRRPLRHHRATQNQAHPGFTQDNDRPSTREQRPSKLTCAAWASAATRGGRACSRSTESSCQNNKKQHLCCAAHENPDKRPILEPHKYSQPDPDWSRKDGARHADFSRGRAFDFFLPPVHTGT